MVTSKVVKRGFLAMAFVTAFALVSFATPTDAEARGCRGYGGHYGGYYGGYGRSYSRSYYGGGYYAPRAYRVGYPSYYHYGRPSGFYYGGRGVSIGIGF